MSKKKLVRLLRTLEKPDRRKFQIYLESGFSSNSPDRLDLFLYLDQNILSKRLGAEQEEVILEKYPGDLKNLTHRLIKDLYSFWSYQGFENDRFQHKFYLIQKLLSLPNFSNDTMKLLEEAIEEVKELSIEHPHRSLELYRLLELYLEHSIRQGPRNSSWHSDLKDAFDSVQLFYNITVLRTVVAYLTSQKLLNSPLSIGVKKTLLELNTYWDDQSPVCSAYFLGANTLHGRNSDSEKTTYYQKLVQNLKEYNQKYHPTILQELVHLALNFAISKINLGRKGDDINKEVEKGKESYLLDVNFFSSLLQDSNSEIRRYDFHNHIMLLARAGGTESAREYLNMFIQNIQAKQSKSEAEIGEKWGVYLEAVILYYEESFTQSYIKTRVKWHWANIEPKLKFQVHLLRIKCVLENELLARDTIEEGKVVTVDQVLENAEKIKSRSEGEEFPDFAESYFNFFLFARELYLADSGSVLLNLRENILACKLLAGREWLLEKIDGTK